MNRPIGWRTLLSSFVALGVAVLSGCARQERAPSAMSNSQPEVVMASQKTNQNRNDAQVMRSQRSYSKPSDAQLQAKLSPLEYEVTQHAATEPPFRNRFWDNHGTGLYVDVATGEPLFSSTDKFESGTGWPSFTKPVEANRVDAEADNTLGMSRTEVKSHAGGSHLGHVFDDGPAPTGLRYCINSASLRFIPVADLEAQGYGEYRALFEPGATTSAAATPAEASSNSCATPAPGETPGCKATLDSAILAGGCFWGMEEILRKIPGVLETTAGYEGGTMPNPTYEDVRTGKTGYAEAVRIVFDPSKISYEDLLEKWFFRMHDPTTKNRQGNDVGTQYRSAIFVTSPEQREVALRVKKAVATSGKWRAPITTEVVDAGPFTVAEDYHQKYLEKHPGGYSCHFMRD